MLVWVVSLSAKKLIPPSLTAKDHVSGIRSLVGFGKLVGPLVHPVLYPRYTTLTPVSYTHLTLPTTPYV